MKAKYKIYLKTLETCQACGEVGTFNFLGSIIDYAINEGDGAVTHWPTGSSFCGGNSRFISSDRKIDYVIERMHNIGAYRCLKVIDEAMRERLINPFLKIGGEISDSSRRDGLENEERIIYPNKICAFSLMVRTLSS